MTIRISLSGLAILLAATAQAQQAPIGQVGAAAQANLDALTTGAATVVPRSGAYGTIGSPYLDKRWLPGRLQMTNGVPMAPVPLKYDVLNHRLMMLPLNRRDSLLLDDRKLASFQLEEPAINATGIRLRTFRRFLEAPEAALRSEYVEVLHSGKYTLLKRHIKQLRKANYQGPYSSGEQYDQIDDKSNYFLLRPDARLVPVKLTLKAMQAAAPELAQALKAAPGASSAKAEEEWVAVLATVDAK
ncbi:hypothetical protein [Hymenobacter metallilatus]|uniref:Uncharacterized protein n=1 Tax=Hymenobacter metallilatus TaxID=2493666 RepID=A0A3R9LWP3_9BACT|nr:hypothetical protein [Hymenobacter metallilatus]RSK29558.1 hypothetical protein EI290_16955 [Hymenobacter metallilatus]